MPYSFPLYSLLRGSAGAWDSVLGGSEVPGQPVIGSLRSPSTRKRVPWVVPAFRVAMDTSSLPVASGHPLTF